VERLVVELPTPGHHIALHHHVPKQPRWVEPVILCHGLAANRFNMDFFEDGHRSDRFSLARALARRGFDVWVLETRGHGWARVPRRSTWTVFDEVDEDVVTAIETVTAVTERDRVFWVGHSWGGLLQLLLQASGRPEAERVAGVVALGTPGRFGRDGALARLRKLSRTADRLGAVRLPLELAARLALPLVGLLNALARRRWPALAPLSSSLLRHLLASLAEDIPPGIVRQVQTWAREGHPIDDAGRPIVWTEIRAPLLLIAGTMDWVAPPEAVAPIAESSRSSDLQLVVLGRTHGHRYDFGHGGLLLSEPAPDLVFPMVADWLAARAQSLESSGADPDADTGTDQGPSSVPSSSPPSTA
jgi:alpha-beta hydrolase superfamily lysophospholipase